jgi:DNA polymerase II large subunit
MRELACSDNMKRYFQELYRENDRCYEIAKLAREQGYDPETFVEIPQAEDLAARVEQQLADYHVEGVAERIRELSITHESREEVSLLVAKEVAKFPAKTREEALDRAVRVGLSVLTEGILVSPIVGIGAVKIGHNNDGTEYVSVFFNGPIRAAGGTGQAMSVLIADVVRREFGIGKYVPTFEEVERLKEEIPLYKMKQHLQYLPSNEEIELIYKNCPVCVDGEKTEDAEISGYRNLPRIGTNAVRGGVALVISEGLCLKAPKLEKHVKNLKMDGWDFIIEYNKKKKGTGEKGEVQIKPDYKYLKDMLAGRPVLSHPSRPGGLRLRYGRGRTTGLAALAVSPATMRAVDDFLAIGTQIKIERPGKAGAITPCDSIEGPILLLKNGDLIQANTMAEADKVKSEIVEIVDLGEVLLPFGEFVENNHVLVPGDYSIEWYKQELLAANEEQLPDDWHGPATFERAMEISKKYSVPLHPDFNLFWYDIKIPELMTLREHLLNEGRWINRSLAVRIEPGTKRTMENLGALHTVYGDDVVLTKYAGPLLAGLGLGIEGEKVVVRSELTGENTMEAVSKAMGVTVRPRAVTRIGTRMARPEKAKERLLSPPPHALFPVGSAGGAQRFIDMVARSAQSEKKDENGRTYSRKKAGAVNASVGLRVCPECGANTILCHCDCGAHTVPRDKPQVMSIPVDELLEKAAEHINEPMPEKLKGVIGLISKNRTPEPLEKGILRWKHGIHVNKDGTIRYDMTDVPLTHFRPREIGLSVGRAKQLGYELDTHGYPLTDAEQVCELKVQDIVPAKVCGDYLVMVADFVDDELEKLYGLPRYYNAHRREDLMGALAIGLAPHTSGGILCRIIGFTDAHVCYGHPFFHAAKRRNADGDEDSVSLLLDGLLNFSRGYLPDSRGGLMDAPLVLATRLDPNEIDKEAHNVDVLWEYPLTFYQATVALKAPKEVQESMDLVGGRIKSLLQYEGFGYTHDTHDIAEGPHFSAYKTLGSMMNKLQAQFVLAKEIRAIDKMDVAHRIVTKHFMPDLIGNLGAFSGQKVRCTKCGKIYRRVPLIGRCYCGNNLTMTVAEGSVKKYLKITKLIGKEYGLPNYTRQRIGLMESSIQSMFGGKIDDEEISIDDFILEKENAKMKGKKKSNMVCSLDIYDGAGCEEEPASEESIDDFSVEEPSDEPEENSRLDDD